MVLWLQTKIHRGHQRTHKEEAKLGGTDSATGLTVLAGIRENGRGRRSRVEDELIVSVSLGARDYV